MHPFYDDVDINSRHKAFMFLASVFCLIFLCMIFSHIVPFFLGTKAILSKNIKDCKVVAQKEVSSDNENSYWDVTLQLDGVDAYTFTSSIKLDDDSLVEVCVNSDGVICTKSEYFEYLREFGYLVLLLLLLFVLKLSNDYYNKD